MIAAYDEFQKISEGENEQLIVSLEKFKAQVTKKTPGVITAAQR